MAVSLLKELVSLEADMENSADYSPKAKAVFANLVAFVESGVYTQSDIQKFIAQHFRLKPAEIVRLYWCSGKKKSL